MPLLQCFGVFSCVSERACNMWKHIEAVPGFQCPSIALDSHESRTTANNGTGLVSIHPRKKKSINNNDETDHDSGVLWCC